MNWKRYGRKHTWFILRDFLDICLRKTNKISVWISTLQLRKTIHNNKKSVKIAGVSAEMRTGYLPNANQNLYSLSQPTRSLPYWSWWSLRCATSLQSAAEGKVTFALPSLSNSERNTWNVKVQSGGNGTAIARGELLASGWFRPALPKP
jgi:hypothetical protein